ncbi:MAG: radical SAM protein [Rhodospirillales bacterium]|nr:radical SAM protein [Rhodospirillales bacterium]
MGGSELAARVPLARDKFQNPDFTAKGEPRAVVALTRLRTLWFNTGSLCNIACKSCYMDSSPSNDALAYLSLADIRRYLDEIAAEGLRVEEIAFTGGEPFMNRELPAMIALALERGFRALVLTNAMKPMLNKRSALLESKRRNGGALAVRVSVDHYTKAKHEAVRGAGSWASMLEGVRWLADNRFNLTIAGRTLWNESEEVSRWGYGDLFVREGIPVDAGDTEALVLFPEMDANRDVPEITVHCWNILGVAPETMMCASSRMVIKRKGATAPVVVPCTLLPYDPAFELGEALSRSAKTVKLNHPYCAQFCVLGGASCSSR